MNITVYRSDILRHEPSAEWLAWFDGLVRMQRRQDSLLIPWRLGLLWLYCTPESRAFAAWARRWRVFPAFDGTGQDLRRIDLRGADLEEAKLEGANLQSADLRWANLERANLYMADLQRAGLEGANLYRAHLYRTNLAGANRSESDAPIPGWKVVNGLLTKE